VVFTADHGESFGEVEGKFHEQMPYWNMANVPLVIDSPDISRLGLYYQFHISNFQVQYSGGPV
jgi:arylsulfatase A-like enzyme